MSIRYIVHFHNLLAKMDLHFRKIVWQPDQDRLNKMFLQEKRKEHREI